MKTAELTTDTLYYAEANYTTGPVLVLDNKPWRRKREGSRYAQNPKYTYAPDPKGKGYGDVGYMGDTRGILVIRKYYGSKDEFTITPEEGAQFLKTLQEGQIPEIHENYRLDVIRPQAIKCTMAEQDRRNKAREQMWADQRAEAKKKASANQAAAKKVQALLGDKFGDFFTSWEADNDQVGRMNWTKMEDLLNEAIRQNMR